MGYVTVSLCCCLAGWLCGSLHAGVAECVSLCVWVGCGCVWMFYCVARWVGGWEFMCMDEYVSMSACVVFMTVLQCSLVAVYVYVWQCGCMAV